LLSNLGYRNHIGESTYDLNVANALITWLESNFEDELNMVVADPSDFEMTDFHYSAEDNRMRR
jgi:hypothetical protein